MGYITTLSIYNDGVHELKKNPEQFTDNIISACHGVFTRDYKSGTFGHGSHVNLVTVQRPRHADDHTCYVHMGNTVREMNPYSKETEYIMENFPEFFDDMLKKMEHTVKELKKFKKLKEDV